MGVGEIERLVAARTGVRVDPILRHRVRQAAIEVARARGWSLDDVARRLHSDDSLTQELLDRVTVQESSFFRDPEQMTAFRQAVLPTLDDPVTIWSAGCGHGQEPYTLAMLMEESGRTGWRVVASDLSSGAVRRTAEGRYTQQELDGVSPDRLARHFTPTRDGWRVRDELRRGVEVHQASLVDDPPPPAAADAAVVFCRNVLIYLRRDAVLTVVDRLRALLPAEGWLFLGYAESLWHLTDAFVLEPVGGAFAYRPAPTVDGGAAHRTVRSGTPAPAPAPERGTAPALVAHYLAAGEAAADAGDAAAAAAAFERASELVPDDPLSLLRLGLAREAQGQMDEAAEAFRRARAALGKGDLTAVVAALEGYRVEELVEFLDDRLVRPG